jgi:hypothetical protein
MTDLRVIVSVPVPEGEDPFEYAERVSSWSLPTLSSGKIVEAEVVEHDG